MGLNAILGGWIGVEIAKRRLGLGHPTGDIYVFPLIAGMCIGRIGYLLGGIEDFSRTSFCCRFLIVMIRVGL
jgi:phosphatidylglycerol---prolipoprotein diacylglyceryl transferase